LRWGDLLEVVPPRRPIAITLSSFPTAFTLANLAVPLLHLRLRGRRTWCGGKHVGVAAVGVSGGVWVGLMLAQHFSFAEFALALPFQLAITLALSTGRALAVRAVHGGGLTVRRHVVVQPLRRERWGKRRDVLGRGVCRRARARSGLLAERRRLQVQRETEVVLGMMGRVPVYISISVVALFPVPFTLPVATFATPGMSLPMRMRT